MGLITKEPGSPGMSRAIGLIGRAEHSESIPNFQAIGSPKLIQLR